MTRNLQPLTEKTFTEELRLGDSSGAHLIQPHCPGQDQPVHGAKLCVLSVWSFSKDRHSTASQDNLLLCSATLTITKIFHYVHMNFPEFQFVPLPLVLSRSTAEKSVALFFPSPIRYILIRSP